MRSLPWLPTDVFSLEAALAQIPGEPFGFHRRKHLRAQIAETRTLRGSGFGYHAGSPFSQAFHSAQPCSCFYGRGSKEFEATSPGEAGNLFPILTERILSGTGRSILRTEPPTPAALSVGGIGLLRFHWAKVFNTSYKNSFPMGLRLSLWSRCTGWKEKTWAGFIRLRSVFLRQFMRFR